jgi:hypothetical protein
VSSTVIRFIYKKKQAKMGGDDLGSGDEYFVEPIHANDDDSSSSDKEQPEDETDSPKNASKRKETENDKDDDDDTSAPKKKRKRERNELRDLGVRIQEESTETQAKLLTEFAGVKFHPHQLTKTNQNPDFVNRIEGIVSKKQLKKWRVKGSPMVVIICQSARRAVQILKDLAPLRTRAAKLFAKHISVEQQKEQMESGSFGFAVGTPHRILTLARDGAVSFEQTRLVVLDTCPNGKNFSVYTLPDTVPHTQALLKEFVYPECSRRKDVRVGFV